MESVTAVEREFREEEDVLGGLGSRLLLMQQQSSSVALFGSSTSPIVRLSL